MMLDLIKTLVENDTDFTFRCVGNTDFVYINGFKDANDYVPYIRVSDHGDGGYYIRYNGLIKEHQTIDDILEMIGEMLYFTDWGRFALFFIPKILCDNDSSIVFVE